MKSCRHTCIYALFFFQKNNLSRDQINTDKKILKTAVLANLFNPIMGLYDPFKKFIGLLMTLYVIKGLLLSLTVFWYGLDVNTAKFIPFITESSIHGGSSSTICKILLKLSFDNAYIYNSLLLMSFFIGHSGILSLNYYFGAFTTFGSFWYDQFFSLFATTHFIAVMKYWMPINESDSFLFVMPFEQISFPILYSMHFLGVALVMYSPFYVASWVKNNPGKLCEANIYKYIRHPTYTGFFLIILSQTHITGGTLLFTGWFGAYCYLATFYNEEVRMVGTFGKSYEEYMGRVPAFCPYLSGPKNKSE